MTVLIVERVSPSVRGELTKWLLEVKAGVFVGKVSGAVRERLWEQACKAVKEGSALLVYTTNTEQGFAMEMVGERSRVLRDFEGLSLITVRQTLGKGKCCPHARGGELTWTPVSRSMPKLSPRTWG
jgi:CRISPR-associated protein Cas2